MPPSTSICSSLILFAAGTSFGILLDRYLLRIQQVDITINDPIQFEASIRQYFNSNSSTNNSNEPCPLDVSPTNIHNFQQGSLTLLLTDIQNTLPHHIYSYITKLLLSRGIHKAMRMRCELINYKKVLVHYQQRYEVMEKSLRRMLAVFHRDEVGNGTTSTSTTAAAYNDSVDKEDIQTSIRLHRELSTIRGCLHILRDVRVWTKNICCIPRWQHFVDSNRDISMAGNNRLFVAGDAAIYKIPNGFAIHEIWRGFCNTEKEYRVKFRNMLMARQTPWPPYSIGNKSSKSQQLACALCGVSVGKAWMSRNKVCWKCADQIKCRGLCPYEKGHPAYLCPHDLSCFSCEGHSCLECRVLRGDGTTFLEMLELGMMIQRQDDDGDATQCKQDESPSFTPFTHVFMDFDQTLSSSKSGGIPRADRHGCNPQLLQILKQSALGDAKLPEVHIVTRQNHTRVNQILTFLDAFGVKLPKSRLHCLGGTAETKAERINLIMMERQCSKKHALFVDDNPAEVCHDGIRNSKNVISVLFVTKDFSCLSSIKQ